MSTDVELAADLAERAGKLLLDLRVRELGETPLDKAAAKELGRRGDKAANVLLLDGLAAERPSDSVLSEDLQTMRPASKRAGLDHRPARRFREYGLVGRSDWAVHVALWERGGASPRPQWRSPRGARCTSAEPRGPCRPTGSIPGSW